MMQPAWKPDLVKLDLKPDRLAGADILRGVGDVGGVRIQSSTVVFAPTMGQADPAPMTIADQVARLRKGLIEVIEQVAKDHPVVLTMLKLKARFTRRLQVGLFRAAWIERVRIKQHLVKHGMGHAAAAIDALPLEDK